MVSQKKFAMIILSQDMSKYHLKYSDDIFLSPNNSFSKIVSLLPLNPKNILDIGCSSGFLGKYIKAKHKCFYCGLDNNSSDLVIAKKFIDKTIIINLETQKIVTQTPSVKFDVIILADILEHLTHPEKILKQLPKISAPHATIIISVPNIIHQSVLINLLQRKWEYQSTGIMDNTHLRFFSKISISKLITNSGFKINKIISTTKNEKLPLFLKPLRLYLQHPDFSNYQYIIKATTKNE